MRLNTFKTLLLALGKALEGRGKEVSRLLDGENLWSAFRAKISPFRVVRDRPVVTVL